MEKDPISVEIQKGQENTKSKKDNLIKQEIAHIEENYEVFGVDHQYSKRIAGIGEKLRDGVSKPIQYKVINAPSVNAFAIGNTVYVYAGMLLFCKTEAELAYILAHEITHIEAGDTYRDGVSLSQARANEYYADSVLHKLSNAGYNPVAIENMLKKLKGGIDYVHGSAADRQAAVRIQLKLKDYTSTKHKDDSLNPFEVDREKIKKETKLGTVDKFIDLVATNRLHILKPEIIDKFSLLTIFKFLGQFYKIIIKPAVNISIYDNKIDRVYRKRNAVKQMRQMNAFMEHVEKRISKELGIKDAKDLLVILFLDFAQIDFIDIARLRQDLNQKEIRFDFPGGFWGDLISYVEKPQKVLRSITDNLKICQNIESLGLITRKSSRELVIGESPYGLALLISKLDFDTRISNFPQENFLEVIRLNLDEKSPKDKNFFLDLVKNCILRSCKDLVDEFKEFINEPDREKFNVILKEGGYKFDLFKKRYKHIYLSAKKLLNAMGIRITTSSLCNCINLEIRFACREQQKLLSDIQTDIVREEMENEPIVDDIKIAISNRDTALLKKILAKINNKEIASFFGSFSITDLCRDGDDLKFFTNFIHEYLQYEYQISEKHRKELFYKLISDKNFNFGKKRGEIRSLVNKDGMEKIMQELGISEDIFRPLLFLYVFEMMSGIHELDFNKIINEKTLGSLSCFSKIILAKKIIYMQGSYVINHSNFNMLIESINNDLKKEDILYHSQVVGSLCFGNTNLLNKVSEGFLKRLEHDIDFENLNKKHIEAIIYSIDILFTESQAREASQVKSRLKLNLLKLLNFDEALEKIKEWKNDQTLHYTHVDYIQEYLISNIDQKSRIDDLMREYTREAKEEHSEKGTSVILLDKSFEDFLNNPYPYGMDSKTVLDAMLNSKYDDALLRQVMVTFWNVYVKKKFDISDLDTLENAIKFMQDEETFEDFMDSFYERISENDIEAILAKLLISPSGVMRYRGGVSVILKALEKEISPEDPELKKLILLVARCGMHSVDPVRIFKPIADILKHRVLKKPKKRGSNKLALKRIKDFNKNSPTDFFSEGVFVNRKRKIAMQNLMDAQLQVFRDRSVNQRRTTAINVEKSTRESLREKIIDYSGVYKVNNAESVTEPMDYILTLAQNMGAVGVRFLQILGQYVEIPKNYESRFADVFDAQRGQIKWTAIDTIEREAKNGPTEFRKFWSNVTHISETIGGGSLMTVYKVRSGNKDYVVKVLNPNAQEFIRQNIEDVEKILKNKKGKLGKKFPLTLNLVNDLSSWLQQDVSSRHKIQETDEFKVVAEDRKSKMFLPGSIYTGSIYVIIEEFIPGKNLNELRKSDIKLYRDMVKVMIKDYREQMVTFYKDGKTKIHTDPHVGNVRLGDDGKLYWLDRGYYIECTKEEMGVITPILSGKIDLSSVKNFFNLLLQDEVNKDKPKLKIASRFIYHLPSMLNRKEDFCNRLSMFIKEIGIEIPIRYSLLFKNEAVINKLLE